MVGGDADLDQPVPAGRGLGVGVVWLFSADGDDHRRDALLVEDLGLPQACLEDG